MRTRTRLVVAASILLLAAGASVSALGASATSSVVGCKSEPGAEATTTASYRFLLRIGMQEKMYTPTQVKKLHPKSGEVMLRGTMSAMGQMAMGSMRHLEVQICSRRDSAVIANASPTIFLIDPVSKAGAAIKVPVAVMEGIGKGLADLHYGNNVEMAAGHHRYTVKVSLRGETATFHVHLALHG